MTVAEDLLKNCIEHENELLDRKMDSVSTMLHTIIWNLDDILTMDNIEKIRNIVKNETLKLKVIEQRTEILKGLNF